MSGQQMERVSSAMMDSPAEQFSHQKMLLELQSIFQEPLNRLDAITEEEWNDAAD